MKEHRWAFPNPNNSGDVEGSELEQKDVGGENWAEEELRAAVASYLQMMDLERHGRRVVKKSHYEQLAARFGRSPKAFEYRMQNISYILSLMGRDWLSGLKPAKNVGLNVGTQIERLIIEIEGRGSVPVVAFEIAVRDQVKKRQVEHPAGNSSPGSFTASVTQYSRESSVKAWVWKQAAGVCECCKRPSPFNGSDGLPYLEIHHVRNLADNGPDTTTNAIAVCPNCHRELHYGERAKELVDSLYQNISRLVRA